MPVLFVCSLWLGTGSGSNFLPEGPRGQDLIFLAPKTIEGMSTAKLSSLGTWWTLWVYLQLYLYLYIYVICIYDICIYVNTYYVYICMFISMRHINMYGASESGFYRRPADEVGTMTVSRTVTVAGPVAAQELQPA